MIQKESIYTDELFAQFQEDLKNFNGDIVNDKTEVENVILNYNRDNETEIFYDEIVVELPEVERSIVIDRKDPNKVIETNTTVVIKAVETWPNEVARRPTLEGSIYYRYRRIDVAEQIIILTGFGNFKASSALSDEAVIEKFFKEYPLRKDSLIVNVERNPTNNELSSLHISAKVDSYLYIGEYELVIKEEVIDDGKYKPKSTNRTDIVIPGLQYPLAGGYRPTNRVRDDVTIPGLKYKTDP